jgi:hypothetical protein
MAKGSSFERYIAKYLSVWLTGSEKPYQYWRMPGSGGLATISEENADLSGDIRSLTQQAAFLTEIFSIELKAGYPKTSFWQLFANIKHFNIEEFWFQCCTDANKADKIPMLIYNKSNRRKIIGIDLITENKIIKYISKLPSMSIRFKNDEHPTIIFYDFEDFFNNITPDIIKRKFNYVKD